MNTLMMDLIKGLMKRLMTLRVLTTSLVKRSTICSMIYRTGKMNQRSPASDPSAPTLEAKAHGKRRLKRRPCLCFCLSQFQTQSVDHSATQARASRYTSSRRRTWSDARQLMFASGIRSYSISRRRGFYNFSLPLVFATSIRGNCYTMHVRGVAITRFLVPLHSSDRS